LIGAAGQIVPPANKNNAEVRTQTPRLTPRPKALNPVSKASNLTPAPVRPTTAKQQASNLTPAPVRPTSTRQQP